MWRFVKHFFKNTRQTGAIIPSGKDLTLAMVEPIEFSKTKNITEIGAGTGVFTKKILEKMSKDCTLTVIEINKEFCAELSKIKDKRMKLIEGDARNLSKIISNADVVVSGLPLASFTKKDRHTVLEEIQKITNQYIQFHYSTLTEKDIRQYFEIKNKKNVLLNVPPAIVYSCKKKHATS